MGRVDPAGGEVDTLEARMRNLWGAYVFLREQELQEVSRTARLLRGKDISYVLSRLCDELIELAGVLTGDHRHSTPTEDIVLESSQICYWTYITALTLGLDYEDLLPHEQLVAGARQAEQSAQALAGAIDFLARRIASCGGLNVQPLLVQTLQTVGLACRIGVVDVRRLVEYDLEQMEQREYLRPYFASGKG